MNYKCKYFYTANEDLACMYITYYKKCKISQNKNTHYNPHLPPTQVVFCVYKKENFEIFYNLILQLDKFTGS